MVSTISSAGWLAASMAGRTAAIRLVTPVEVSLCTTQTALIACAGVGRQPLLDDGLHAVAPVAGHQVGLEPERAAIFCHSVAKWPVSNISTRSPGLSVLTSAASQAPVPDAG